MTLSSRHRIRNSSLGGLRPSTLPLGHEDPPHVTFTCGWGRNIFCFFQTAETGNQTPNSGVKGSGANHYPRAPALLDEYWSVSQITPSEESNSTRTSSGYFHARLGWFPLDYSGRTIEFYYIVVSSQFLSPLALIYHIHANLSSIPGYFGLKARFDPLYMVFSRTLVHELY